MSADMPGRMPDNLQLPVVWTGVEEAPVLFANQALGQIGAQGEVVLTFGRLIPPAFVGTSEQITEQAKQMSHIPTETLARVVLTRAGLTQLIEVLQQTDQNYERAQELEQQMQNRMDSER